MEAGRISAAGCLESCGCERVKCTMSQVFLFLMSVVMPSWGNDMSVDMVVANNVHHGSYMRLEPDLSLVTYLAQRVRST